MSLSLSPSPIKCPLKMLHLSRPLTFRRRPKTEMSCPRNVGSLKIPNRTRKGPWQKSTNSIDVSSQCLYWVKQFCLRCFPSALFVVKNQQGSVSVLQRINQNMPSTFCFSTKLRRNSNHGNLLTYSDLLAC